MLRREMLNFESMSMEAVAIITVLLTRIAIIHYSRSRVERPYLRWLLFGRSYVDEICKIYNIRSIYMISLDKYRNEMWHMKKLILGEERIYDLSTTMY
jgi:hypothetical protein